MIFISQIHKEKNCRLKVCEIEIFTRRCVIEIYILLYFQSKIKYLPEP